MFTQSPLSEPCCAYTLQRASWLLPIVDHGVDNDEEEREDSYMSAALDVFMDYRNWG